MDGGEELRRRLVVLAALVVLVGGFGLYTVRRHRAVYHFGVRLRQGGRASSIETPGMKAVIDEHGAIYLGDASRKELFLTFDNGYENGLTASILDTLKAKKVPCIFFVTGSYATSQPALLARMAEEGHLIGNHTWSHPELARLDDLELREQLDPVKAAVAAITGDKTMRFLRPPNGVFSARSLAFSKNLGYTSVFWSFAYKDWDTDAQQGWKHAHAEVMAHLHPGAVILLHAVSRDNADALSQIIDDARHAGYDFKRLDQLVRAR